MSPKKHLCYVWCCYGNSTRRKCPSSLPLQVAEFWGTPSESVWCHPRNICAKFGDCTQKCTIKLLSDPTNITFDTQLKTALAGKVAHVLLALDHRAYLKTPPPPSPPPPPKMPIVSNAQLKNATCILLRVLIGSCRSLCLF